MKIFWKHIVSAIDHIKYSQDGPIANERVKDVDEKHCASAST